MLRQESCTPDIVPCSMHERCDLHLFGHHKGPGARRVTVRSVEDSHLSTAQIMRQGSMHLLAGRTSRMSRRPPLLPRRCKRLTAAAMAGTGNALPTRTLPGKPVTRPHGQLAACLTELGRPLACKALEARSNISARMLVCWGFLGFNGDGRSHFSDSMTPGLYRWQSAVKVLVCVWDHGLINSSCNSQYCYWGELHTTFAGLPAAHPARRGRHSSSDRVTPRAPRQMHSTQPTGVASTTSAASRG